MSEIAEFIRLGMEIIGRGRERRRAMEGQSWDAFLETAATLQELLPQHEAAIRSVVSPVTYDGDLTATCGRYRELSENASVFSSAYGDASGMLSGAQRFKQFEQGPGKNYLNLVRHRFAAFQSAAFCLEWRSELMTGLFIDADRLRLLLAREDPAEHAEAKVATQRKKVHQQFQSSAFPALRVDEGGEAPAYAVGPLESGDQVVGLVRDWCALWLDRVSAALYKGGRCEHCGDTKHEYSDHGLFRILGEMKALRYAG